MTRQDEARLLVRQLAAAGDTPDPALLREILAYGDAAVPALCAALDAANRRDASWDLAEFSTYLLGLLKSAEAVPCIVATFYLAEGEMGDLMWEMPALRSIGPPAIDALLAVTSDDALEHFPRALAWDALADIILEHPAERPRILAAMRAELDRRLSAAPEAEMDREMATTMVNMLADFADAEGRPLLDAAFDRGMIDPKVITQADVKEAYAKGVNRRRMPDAEEWFERYVAEQARQRPSSKRSQSPQD